MSMVSTGHERLSKVLIHNATGSDCITIFPDLPPWETIFFNGYPPLGFDFYDRNFGGITSKVGWVRFGRIGHKAIIMQAGVLKAPKLSSIRNDKGLFLPAGAEHYAYDLDAVIEEGYKYDVMTELGNFTPDQIGMIITRLDEIYLVLNLKYQGLIAARPLLVEPGNNQRSQILSRGEMFKYLNLSQYIVPIT